MPNIQEVINRKRAILQILNDMHFEKAPRLFTTNGRPDVLGMYVTPNPTREVDDDEMHELRKALEKTLSIEIDLNLSSNPLICDIGSPYAKGPMELANSELAKEFGGVEFAPPGQEYYSPPAFRR